MFKIRMLPADYGDCLWVEYGDPRKPRRILIDAGTLVTFKEIRRCIETELPAASRQFELLIVTHIDNDHIDAAVKLLNASSLGVRYRQVWFNGWNQLLDADGLGPRQGEYLSALIEQQQIPHNKSFRGRAVCVPPKGKLPRKKLPGGMTLTLLSPGPEQLQALRAEWKALMGAAAGDSQAALRKLATIKRYKDTLGPARSFDVRTLAAAPIKPDTSKPNASSIAFLAEYDGKRCLFAADANPLVLEQAVDRLIAEEGGSRLRLDAFKVPHHGSQHNVPATLIGKLNCRNYLVSTNGRRFSHPDPEAVARLIASGGPGARLFFNYETDFTRPWNTSPLRTKHRYQVTFRPDSAAALDIEL